MRKRRVSRVQALAFWLCTFLGGGICGAGLFLLGQVHVLRHVREQVDQLNAFERFLGKFTFLWRELDEKVYLALSDIPQGYIDHSEEAAYWLIGLGFAGVALLVPWYLRRRWQ